VGDRDHGGGKSIERDEVFEKRVGRGVEAQGMKTVVVLLKGAEYKERLEEIGLLARTAGYQVERYFTQKAPPRARFFIGKGKVDEIRVFCQDNSIEAVIFEDFLGSRQIMDLETRFGLPVMDRYDLILNVFEAHAGSREAMLQIELARLKRKLPYIKLHANRRVKVDHPGFGSSGEYVVHSTLTAVQKRIKKIHVALESYTKVVDGQDKRRKKLGKVVALAGYTNVGKTTILNALTGAGKPARDELFTTLGPKTRRSKDGIFITDTIGFIRNLPPELIHSFSSTLKSIMNADLILLILDASDDMAEFEKKKDTCEETLMRIGADHGLVLHVLNKVDMKREMEAKRRMLPSSLEISAKDGTGLKALQGKVREVLGVPLLFK
jgi:GTP-binding protein HflX